MINPYHDDFNSWEDVQRDFQMTHKAPRYVLFASYSYENYEGSAIVIYYDNDKYWLVEGGHCSCHGLEGQWEPIEYATADLVDKCILARAYGLAEQYKNFISDALARNEARVRRANK